MLGAWRKNSRCFIKRSALAIRIIPYRVEPFEQDFSSLVYIMGILGGHTDGRSYINIGVEAQYHMTA
jgi:hypothetical protein